MLQTVKRVLAVTMVVTGLAFGLSACTPAEEEESGTQEELSPQIDTGGAEQSEE